MAKRAKKYKKKAQKKYKKQKGGVKRQRRRRIYGGALGDYIPDVSAYVPSIDTAASYVPGATTALGYYRTGKQAVDTAKKAYGLYNKYKPVIDSFLPQGPPPIPDSMPPPLSKRDLAHNREIRLKNMSPLDRKIELGLEELRRKHPGVTRQSNDHSIPQPSPYIQSSKLGKAVSLGYKYRPISFIDNGLKHFGVRDKVRGFLSRNNLGFLNSGADALIQQGFNPYRRPVPSNLYRRRSINTRVITKAYPVIKRTYNRSKLF